MNDLSISGYFGRYLEIDLSRQEAKTHPLPLEIIEDFIGGRGLATRLFIGKVNPSCDPLGPENVLVIAVSALVGTRAPTAGRGHMVFKSPLTGMIGSSNCGGTWAPAFKSTGFDAIVITGKAKSPVVIDIRPGAVEFMSAKNIWGMDVPATTEELAGAFSANRRAHILCIGPAGENQVLFASVMNDKNRAYGRSGPGAVFGSKNLKAIRVSGREKPFISDLEHFQSGLDQARYLLKAAPASKRLMRELGTAGLVELINIIDMLPHRNFQDTLHREEDVEKISGEAIRRSLLQRAGGCFGCPIACQRHTMVNGKTGEGPEYETDVMLGPDCGIYDLEAIARTNYVCNEMGMDTISFGGTLACAMELFEKGFITASDTEGLDLHFGNASVLEEMARKTALREGIGGYLAEGSLRFSTRFHHPEYSMSVKGLEIPAYDPRASYTQALGYMTSPTGACHMRGGYAVSLAFFGGTKEIPRFSLHQSPLAIRNMQNLGILQDTLGVCRFTGFAFSMDPWSRMLSGITGLPFSTARLEETANRIAALEHLFNIRAGLNSDMDSLPDRFSLEPIMVDGKEKLFSKSDMDQMKQDYYTVREWDVDGDPTRKLLDKLRIDL